MGDPVSGVFALCNGPCDHSLMEQTNQQSSGRDNIFSEPVCMFNCSVYLEETMTP
jgi:hypothetical protein